MQCRFVERGVCARLNVCDYVSTIGLGPWSLGLTCGHVSEGVIVSWSLACGLPSPLLSFIRCAPEGGAQILSMLQRPRHRQDHGRASLS